MKKAIVFLTATPQFQTVEFATLVQKELPDFDVFIVIDHEAMVMPINDLKIIQPSDADCIKAGYNGTNIVGATHIKKSPIAFDKCLYHFCEIDKSYDFIWPIEDDVFIPSPQTLKNLHDKYSSNDLVTANNNLKTDRVTEWHWKHIFSKINGPYYYSMSCAIGISKKMLQTIKVYVDKNKELFHLEAMLNTLAMQNDLKVCTPLELKSIVWMGEWGLDEFLLLPNNLFHPKKEIDQHQVYREQIKEAIASPYKPRNKLPKFITDFQTAK